MNTFLYILISIAIAGFIGGITNHLAIKMLFYPRKPVMLGRFRVPFTPGLIPKRRDEIAESLGKVVGDYLVTSHGIANTLRKPEFTVRMVEKWEGKLVDFLNSQETLEQLAARFWNREQLEAAKARFSGLAASALRFGVDAAWEGEGLGGMRAVRLIPGWGEEKKAEWKAKGADFILGSLKRELASPAGDRLLRSVAGQLIGQAGGFLGALAGMFIDEDKIVQKLKPVILEQLDSHAVRYSVQQLVGGQLDRLEEFTLGGLMQEAVGEDLRSWVERFLSAMPIEKWTDGMLKKAPGELLGHHKEGLLAQFPRFVGWALQFLADQMDRIIDAIDLPAVVEEQVRKFPMERIEGIVLNISGREFRAITWLGVFLGGLIGIVQIAFALLLR